MQMAEIGGVSLRSQQQYEKGNVAPTTDYLTRLYEAGFDVVYLITGKRNTETLTAEDSELKAKVVAGVVSGRAYLAQDRMACAYYRR